MSINSAIDNALSGMTAESARLSSISSNVANSSTVGYKASETDFESMVLGSGNGNSTGGGVQSVNWTDIATAGQIQSTGVSTNIAINGQGFMVVKDAAAAGSGSYYLTQVGSFQPDANGNLVNASGYYLQGQPINVSGVAGAVPQPFHGERRQPQRGGDPDHGDDLQREPAVERNRLQRDRAVALGQFSAVLRRPG